MSQLDKQVKIITKDMEEEAQKTMKMGMERFLGTVAGLARQMMQEGKTVGIYTGFLAASLKSENTPEKYQVDIAEDIKGGWSPDDYHVEKIVMDDDEIRGEMGTGVWYARVQAKGGQVGPNNSVSIEPTPFLEPAFEKAKDKVTGIFLEGMFEEI